MDSLIPVGFTIVRHVEFRRNESERWQRFAIGARKILTPEALPSWIVCYEVFDERAGEQTIMRNGVDDLQAIVRCAIDIDTRLAMLSAIYEVAINQQPFDRAISSILFDQRIKDSVASVAQFDERAKSINFSDLRPPN